MLIYTNMKNEKLESEIEIPSGIIVNIHKDEIIFKKEDKEIRRKLNPMIRVKVEEGKIKITSEKFTKREKKNFGSIKAHVKNAIEGLNNPWKYKLQIAMVHFPTTALIDKDTNEFVLKNFLGEKKDRRVKLSSDVEIKINKDIIEITSSNVEKAGQTAANLEKLTKVRNRDRRIFQDGIFIIEKPGREFI